MPGSKVEASLAGRRSRFTMSSVPEHVGGMSGLSPRAAVSPCSGARDGWSESGRAPGSGRAAALASAPLTPVGRQDYEENLLRFQNDVPQLCLLIRLKHEEFWHPTAIAFC